MQFNIVKRIKLNHKSRFKHLRLDKNERVSKFPKKFVEIFKKKLSSENFSIYPEIYKFYELLSKKHHLSKKHFIAIAGIDAGLRNCIELFGNKKIIVLDPTFAMINIYCKVLKKKTIKINYNSNFKLNFKKLYSHINNKVSLIVISNPNSPTGTVLNIEEIKKILEKAKKNKIHVVIDEAYYGFCSITSISLIRKFDNLIVLRTFSKAYGLAGLRIGYAISNAKNINKLINIKPMYEVNSLGVLGANILLKNEFIRTNYLKNVSDGKKILLNFFNSKNIKFINTNGNFVLFKLQKKRKSIFKKLKLRKINIVEKFNYKNLKNYSRITLAPSKEINKFTRILRSY